MFDTVEFTLSAAVAPAGTFTVSYPAGRSAGDYTGAHAHKLYIINADYVAPADFTVTFGASNITVTHGASTTWPAGSKGYLQIDRLGANDGDPGAAVIPDTLVRAPLHLIDLGSPDTADPNGYVESQDLTSAGVFSVNTTATAAIAAAALAGTPDVPRNVVAAWSSAAVLTVTGKDVDGNVMVESSSSGTSFTGTKAFAEVTDIAVSANVTGLTVGTGNVLGLPVYVADAGYILDEFEDGVRLKAEKANQVRVPFQIDQTDLLAGTPISVLSPVAGVISKVVVMTWKAVGTGGNITMKVNNTSVDGLTVVVADSAAAGDVDQDTPTAGHASTVVAVDDELEIIPASEFATTGAVTGYIEIELTSAQQLNGTLVVGDTSEATATTGDVRGTYTPTTTPDGATAFALLASLSDPANDGVAQYAG